MHMSRITQSFVLTMVASGLVLVSSARGQTPLTIENIVGRAPGARQAAISPDARWVAVTANGSEGDGIYAVSTITAEAPKLWTQGSSPVWLPDGKRIVFSSGSDLWIVELGSSEAKQITSDTDDERAATISPDGTTVAFYSTRSGHQDIWLVGVDGGTPRQLTEAAMAEDDYRFTPAWSPNGKQIAYISNKNGYWEDDVWVVEVASGEARQVSKGLMASSAPAWSPNGSTIALMGTSKQGYWYEDLADIYLIDPAAGTERTVEMQIYASDWLHSQPVIWSGDGERLYFPYLERGDFNIWSVPVGGGVATRVTNMQGSISSLDATPTAGAFVFVRSTPIRGADVDVISSSGGVMRRLTQFAGTWAGIQDPLEISYRSWDGLYIQGFLYLPHGLKAGEKYPALVNVHGGGTNSYLRTENLIEQYLASKGYLVLAINYRGGSGFGREFQNLSINDWVNGQAKDAAAAADFLRSLGACNGKVGIYGYSYGGIMSLGTIARAPDKFDAAVPMAGIYDFADAYQNADRVGKIFIRTGHSGPPEERKETYDISHTLARVEDIQTPLLIMHGEADVRVPFRQYELAVELLKKYGKTFENKSYPDEPHGFRNPANRIDMYQRLEAFFEKYLKATPAP